MGRLRGGLVTLWAMVTTVYSQIVCPAGKGITLTQGPLVPRRGGEAVLTCDIPSATEVKYYQWLVEDFNEPLYTNTNVLKPGDGNFGDGPISRSLSPKETNYLQNDGIRSSLTLQVNLTDTNTYRCGVRGPGSTFCKKSIEIDFEDPTLTLTYRQLTGTLGRPPKATYEITCTVDAASPGLEMVIGHDAHTDGSAPLRPLNVIRVGQLGWRASTEERLSVNSLIFCKVVDRFGTFMTKQTISPDVAQAQKIIIPVVVVLVLLLALIVAGLVWYRRRRRTIGYKAIPMQGISSIYDDYFSKRRKWTHIKNMSQTPVLFGLNGPERSDIQQAYGVQNHTWFLSALYSICWSCKYGTNPFAQNFEGVAGLDTEVIPIKLWCYGEWKTIEVEPTLPTMRGQPCFLHSANKDVFWSALLQKAYLTAMTFYRGLDSEMDIHALGDITGNVLFSETITGYEYKQDELCEDIAEDLAIGKSPICCRREDKVFLFYNIIGVKEVGEKQFRLHEFTDTKMSTKTSTFCEKYTCNQDDEGSTNNDFWMPLELLFRKDFQDIHWYLTKTQKIKEVKGSWQNISGRLKDDELWTYPQYYMEWSKGAVFNLVLLQKPVSNRETYVNTSNASVTFRKKRSGRRKEEEDALALGFRCFKVKKDYPKPQKQLHQGDESIEKSGFSEVAQITRERITGWEADPLDTTRIIFIPYAQGDAQAADFLLRMYLTSDTDTFRGPVSKLSEEHTTPCE